GAFRQKTGFMGIRVHADYTLHCGRADAPWRSLSAIIDDAARAFLRPAPMTFAEASAHALVAHYASDQVTAAARQAYMHRLPRMRLQCFARFRNRRTDACGCRALCYRWGRAYPCLQLRHRALSRPCALPCLGAGSVNGRLGG